MVKAKFRTLEVVKPLAKEGRPNQNPHQIEGR